jgi:hypothetical protein
MKGASREPGRIGRTDALSIRDGSDPSWPASPSSAGTNESDCGVAVPEMKKPGTTIEGEPGW